MDLKDNKNRRLKRVTKDEFLQRVQKPVGCWLYDGAREINGYGYLVNPFGDQPKYITAHRASWIYHNGPIPEGLQVLHKCDVRGCINPEHLFLGTKADNALDMHRKRRHPLSKFTPEDVRAIRTALAAGATQKMLADKYKATSSSISMIATGKNYGWVE